MEDLVQAQQQRYSLGPLSAAAACVVGIHCCVAEEGYPEKTDAAWKARTWRGHDGTYTLTYRAEMEGRECELVLKCVEMGSEILVHSSTGHSDRASMRCTLSDGVRPSGGADGTSSEPRLIQRGEVLQQMLPVGPHEVAVYKALDHDLRAGSATGDRRKRMEAAYRALHAELLAAEVALQNADGSAR